MSVLWEEQHGWFFVPWVFFLFFNLLIEDLAEGQVFFKIIHTRKRQEMFGDYRPTSVRCSNITFLETIFISIRVIELF